MVGKSSKRSLDTCNTCRARKVRCDGTRSVCGSCDRLGLPCSYQSSVDQESSSLTLPRQRSRRACRGCRQRKMRCTGDLPSCERCQHLELECSYPRLRLSHPVDTALRQLQGPNAISDAPRTSLAASPPRLSNTSPRVATGRLPHEGPSTCTDSLSLPDEATMARVFDNFFHHLYPIPVFSFLHKASLIQRYRAGLGDDILLFAMVGITSLLIDLGPETRETSSRFIDAAESLILGRFDRPSIAKVQALVLIIEHRILSERSEAAFTLISIAVRHSYALRLNYENPRLCFLAQESRRRLMWSVFLLDLHLASGLSDFTLCSAESLHIQLPCNETSFELDIPQTTEPLVPVPDQLVANNIGLVALFVRLSWIRGKILHTTKRIVVSRTQDVDSITGQVHALAKELSDFAASLPLGYQLTERNLQLRAHTNRMAPYTLLHILWRKCHCLLYRIALEGLHEALPRPIIRRLDPTFVLACQRECFDKASTVVDAFRTILALKEQPPFLDFHLPICAYQCARLLFYTYRTNAATFGLSLDSVVEQTHRCLDMITRSPCPRKGLLVVQRDLESLIERGCSRSPTPDRPRMESQLGAPPHMISRHSLLKGLRTEEDGSDALTLPSGISPATTTSHPQPGYANADTAVQVHSHMSRAPDHQQSQMTSDQMAVMHEDDLFAGGLDAHDQALDFLSLNTWKWPFDLWPGYHDPLAASPGQEETFDDGQTNQYV